MTAVDEESYIGSRASVRQGASLLERKKWFARNRRNDVASQAVLLFPPPFRGRLGGGLGII
jgi:hypothetical protein